MRQGTSIETLSEAHWPVIPADILRRICEQCAIADIEYFDPVLCDGVSQRRDQRDHIDSTSLLDARTLTEIRRISRLESTQIRYYLSTRKSIDRRRDLQQRNGKHSDG